MRISSWLTQRTLGPIGKIAREAGSIDDRRLSDRLSGGQAEDESASAEGADESLAESVDDAPEAAGADEPGEAKVTGDGEEEGGAPQWQRTTFVRKSRGI